ncbi:MAG: rhodanese-like domain-containing protein [Planctomycetota bacterium]|nr:rhodanese-like domain-containing protein [Planctomycetota bacterium]
MSEQRHQVLTPFLGLVAIAAILSTAPGCKTETSDRDLRPVAPQEAIDLAVPRSDGAFGRMSRPVWLDPRIRRAYDAGHIPGALSMPFGSGMFEDRAREELEGRSPIIVYGDGFQDILSDAASKRLIEMGFKDVYTLRGGIQQWEADGYEIETAAGD